MLYWGDEGDIANKIQSVQRLTLEIWTLSDSSFKEIILHAEKSDLQYYITVPYILLYNIDKGIDI